MLMILARLVRSESFWAVVKVRSPHTGPGISYIISPPSAAPRRLPPALSRVPKLRAGVRGANLNDRPEAF